MQRGDDEPDTRPQAASPLAASTGSTHALPSASQASAGATPSVLPCEPGPVGRPPPAPTYGSTPGFPLDDPDALDDCFELSPAQLGCCDSLPLPGSRHPSCTDRPAATPSAAQTAAPAGGSARAVAMPQPSSPHSGRPPLPSPHSPSPHAGGLPLLRGTGSLGSSLPPAPVSSQQHWPTRTLGVPRTSESSPQDEELARCRRQVEQLSGERERLVCALQHAAHAVTHTLMALPADTVLAQTGLSHLLDRLTRTLLAAGAFTVPDPSSSFPPPSAAATAHHHSSTPSDGGLPHAAPTSFPTLDTADTVCIVQHPWGSPPGVLYGSLQPVSQLAGAFSKGGGGSGGGGDLPSPSSASLRPALLRSCSQLLCGGAAQATATAAAAVAKTAWAKASASPRLSLRGASPGRGAAPWVAEAGSPTLASRPDAAWSSSTRGVEEEGGVPKDGGSGSTDEVDSMGKEILRLRRRLLVAVPGRPEGL